MTKQVLGQQGRGLLGLVGAGTRAVPATANEPNTPSAPLEIPVAQINTSPYQPRRVFDDAKLAELAESIKELGMVQPLVVRRLDASHYQLIAGERRLRAAVSLNWGKVPVVISNATEDVLRESAIVENIQRENLNAIELAEALKELFEQTGLTHDKVAARLGKSRAWITNTLRLLNLPPEVCQLVAADKISPGHGKALLGLVNESVQKKLAQRVVTEQMPVQKLEKIIQQITGGRAATKAKKTAAHSVPAGAPSTNRYLLDLEKQLGGRIGAQVKIVDQNGAGKIEITYASYDEIAGILERLGIVDH